jgi:5-carboxymethyl-2-hydroxymuconate isomerase
MPSSRPQTICAVEADGGPVTIVLDADGRAVSPPDAEAAVASIRPCLSGPLAVDADLELRNGRPTAPLRPRKIAAVGLNYRDHIAESGLDVPTSPLLFAKFTSSVTGPEDDILIDRSLTQRVDWEVELAVVIGARMRNVSVSSALEYVFGYTVANDVSARDLQFSDGQWVRGKSLDTFCPIGPGITSASAIPDPQALRLRTEVNGEVMQDSTTAKMIFTVAEILAFCSRSFTLDPGDLVLTGTPWGCGEFMTPPRHLEDGDLVEVSIEGIGKLRNRVRETRVDLPRGE